MKKWSPICEMDDTHVGFWIAICQQKLSMYHLQYQCEDLLSTQNRRPVVEDIFLDKNRQIPQQEA